MHQHILVYFLSLLIQIPPPIMSLLSSSKLISSSFSSPLLSSPLLSTPLSPPSPLLPSPLFPSPSLSFLSSPSLCFLSYPSLSSPSLCFHSLLPLLCLPPTFLLLLIINRHIQYVTGESPHLGAGRV